MGIRSRPCCRGTSPVADSNRLFAPDQRDHKKNQEDEETDFGDAGSDTGESTESEHASDKSHDDEGKSPGKHNFRELEWLRD